MTTELTVYQYKKNHIRSSKDGNGKVWYVVGDLARATGGCNVTELSRRATIGHLQKHQLLAPDGKMRLHWVVDKAGLGQILSNNKELLACLIDSQSQEEISLPSQEIMSRKELNMYSELAANVANLTLIVGQLVKDIATNKLPAGPAPITIPALTSRDRFNMACRNIARTFGWQHKDAYNAVYYEYDYRYHTNLRERATNKHMQIIDYADQHDMLLDLCNIAEAILTNEISTHYIVTK
jgi:hypothetical protein